MSVVDLDLTVTCHSDSTMAAIQISQPGQPLTPLAPPTPWAFDKRAIDQHTLDPARYGQTLTEQLFSDQALRMAWHEVSAIVRARGDKLRLRIILPTSAPELHALRWETLHDPVRNAPLAVSDRFWLVRLPTTASLEAIPQPPHTGLRASVVVASPRNLARYQLAEIDVDGEVARARRALGSSCTAIVGDHDEALRRQASLAGILAALRHSPHILYLVCHGRMEGGETMLCLEGDAGEVSWLRGSALVEAIENLWPKPLLAILIACRSAGDGYGEAINAIGPQLARAGIPAVIGFQGDVRQRTVRRCMATLWDELRRDGRIDRALAAARREIHEDWWQPVLWLRAYDGRLWPDEQPLAPTVAPTPPPVALPEQTALSPQLRELSAALWFESEQHSPNWPLVEQLAAQLLAIQPDDTLARHQLAEAGRQLALQARYQTITQRRNAGVGYEEVAAALESLERSWAGFPDPDGLRAWVAERRRTAQLKPALDQLRERQGAHAALDMIERFLESHPADADAAQLTAEIAEMAAAPFEQRLRAAEMAGQIGDPRAPISVDQWRESLTARSYEFGRPNGYWCYLPGGAYRIGAPDTQADVVLPAFWIARYPITVAQYAEFVRDGGYDEARWWTSEGWQLRQRGAIPPQPWGWDEPHLTRPNQPVTGVSWDEAMAFCAWLSQRLRPTLLHYQIRLPDERMWELAACYGPDQQPHSYPWGEDAPDIDRAIHMTQPRRLHDDAPAPVGCSPAGAAPCGAIDMAGNVWELMASSWESYPHEAAQPMIDGHIAWRGGSWAQGAPALRCSARDRTRRQGHNFAYGGFRIVVAPQA